MRVEVVQHPMPCKERRQRQEEGYGSSMYESRAARAEAAFID